MRRSWQTAAIGAWACGLAGCYIPGSGWTLRSGVDVCTCRKPALYVEMVDTRWDEWNRVAQINAYGGGGVATAGYAADPAAAQPVWSGQPAYPAQPANPVEWQSPQVVPNSPATAYPPPPLVPPVTPSAVDQSAVPPVSTPVPSAPAVAQPTAPATPAPAAPAPAPAPPVETLPPAESPSATPLPPPPSEPRPAEKVPVALSLPTERAPTGPAPTVTNRRRIPDETPPIVRRADVQQPEWDTTVPPRGRGGVVPAGGSGEVRGKVELGAPVVEELPEPYVPRNPLKAGQEGKAPASPESGRTPGHTGTTTGSQKQPTLWQRVTSPFRGQP